MFTFKNKNKLDCEETKGPNPTAIGNQPLIGWNRKRRKTYLKLNTSTHPVLLKSVSFREKCQSLSLIFFLIRLGKKFFWGLTENISHFGSIIQSDYCRFKELFITSSSERENISRERGQRLKVMREDLKLHCLPVSLITGIHRVEDLEDGSRIMSQFEYYKLISFYRQANKSRLYR